MAELDKDTKKKAGESAAAQEEKKQDSQKKPQEEAAAQKAAQKAAADEAQAAKDDEEASKTQDEEVTDEADAADGADGDKKKSGFFNRKEKKKDPKDQKIEELQDRVLRQMAEFDNYRKRTDKEKSQMFDSGAGDVLEKILPVIDDMERGLGALSEEEKETSFAKGMEMIYKKLMAILETQGVTAIEAVGTEFNPNFHNAVMQAPSTEYESGYVTQELQKGYMFKDRVLRHSMVIVAE